MISFDNTEIAFSGKSDKDLHWAYRLFKLIGKPWLVNLGSFFGNLSLKLRLPVKGMIKKTIFKQFCGGENIADCEIRIKELGKYNVGTILDYSVEGKDSEEDLDKTRDEIIQTILKAKSNSSIPFSVFKVTGIIRTDLLEKWNNPKNILTATEQAELKKVLQRVDDICQSAFENNVPVFIDAEDSWFQDGIDRIANDMMKKYNQQKAIVFNTVQMYRHDRLAFLQKTFEEANSGKYFVGIKLVRGAYMEKERARALKEGYQDPIQPNKEATDRDYDLALKFMLDHLEVFSICAGTHNEKSSALLAEEIIKRGLQKNDSRIYFAQLLGMSDHISFNLAHHQFNVAKYVPYGPVREVMPYLMRRAKENTSVAGQTGRELSLIIKEKKRRQTIKKEF